MGEKEEPDPRRCVCRGQRRHPPPARQRPLDRGPPAGRPQPLGRRRRVGHADRIRADRCAHRAMRTA
ncbi:hypothetical protein F7R91_25165 [Streptomyces luteolifulvus]|uniref:Uncharacterized protein n=1 Tax=Streptomyces luteolifulvus TaxID=2615112 RepID=A0A6H9UVM2_9ACTN|nr:hypothetical protein F7R91_25165 [Streptomyces luteolifulvus]